MNIEAYISSGILELYALNELSDVERAEVNRLCQDHEEIRAELAQIESTLEALAQTVAVTPDPALKSKIADILELSASEPKSVQMTTPTPKSGFNYAIAASISIAVIATAMAVYFYSQWQMAEDRLDVMIAQNQEFADNYEFVNQRLQSLETDVEILANPNFARIAMNSTENAPGSLATVYWNANTEEVYLKIQNLKTLSQEEQYQLWAIVDGIPVDMGVFDNEQALLKMKSTGSAAAFAVTIEPLGGSENPSLETMQVIGNTEV